MQPLAQVGRYRIEREVARGGMGAVYRARTPEGRPVALKLLLAGQAASPLQRRRVATEVQALLRLRHENVVELLDAGEHEGVPWLVMEWVQGETLGARLEREGPQACDAAAGLVRQLAGALAHCHAQGVVHRDLKPENVLLRAGDGVPLLTDFGLSKDVANEGDSRASFAAGTVRGRWLGTPGYWPPEQARGELEAIGPRSDVYGLGAVLYACLTGSPPHAGEGLAELIASLERPPEPPGRRRQGVPPWLDAVCLRALATDPAHRQASAADLERELREGLAGRLTEQGTARGAASPARSPAARVAALLLVLGGSAALAITVRGRGSAATPPPARRPQPPARAAEPAPGRPAQAPEPTGRPPETVAPETSDVEFLLARAEGRLEEGDLAGALADCARVTELDPRHVPAWVGRALVKERQGDLSGARADLDRALELDPRSDTAYYNRGNVRLKQDDPRGALADWTRVIELTPEHASAHCSRGALHESQGDPAAALADYERAIELDPDFGMAWGNRGYLRQQQGDLVGAMADFDRAIELDPEFPQAWANRGALRRAQGDLAGALTDYERFAALVPDHPQAPAARALVERLRAQLAGGQ